MYGKYPLKCLGALHCPFKGVDPNDPVAMAAAAWKYWQENYKERSMKSVKTNYNIMGAGVYCGKEKPVRCNVAVMYFRSKGRPGSKNNVVEYNK
jgi:hypothetical protein